MINVLLCQGLHDSFPAVSTIKSGLCKVVGNDEHMVCALYGTLATRGQQTRRPLQPLGLKVPHLEFRVRCFVFEVGHNRDNY